MTSPIISHTNLQKCLNPSHLQRCPRTRASTVTQLRIHHHPTISTDRCTTTTVTTTTCTITCTTTFHPLCCPPPLVFPSLLCAARHSLCCPPSMTHYRLSCPLFFVLSDTLLLPSILPPAGLFAAGSRRPSCPVCALPNSL